MTTRAFAGDAPQFAVRRTVWSGLLQNDVGQAQDLPGDCDISCSAEGTFGSGATCTMEGSNDGGVNWHPIKQPNGTLAVFSAASFVTFLDLPAKVRPNNNASDGTTNIAVTLIARIKSS